jgi:hypothetical protein
MANRWHPGQDQHRDENEGPLEHSKGAGVKRDRTRPAGANLLPETVHVSVTEYFTSPSSTYATPAKRIDRVRIAQKRDRRDGFVTANTKS